MSEAEQRAVHVERKLTAPVRTVPCALPLSLALCANGEPLPVRCANRRESFGRESVSGRR